MSVATMMATLKLNISDFASKLDTASSKLTKFANKTQSDYGKASSALKSHNLGLKDTARIVQGIVISQAFYTAANAIAGATSALWNFNKQLDYTKVTYSALFGSTDLADKFSTALQEHAVETIFDYQQLSEVSKKLLAYGIEYKNLMYVMEGMTNLGAMSGDTQAMDRIALALGQIKTTGYLTATEMRQLANAYVPIYDIVQNAFGLSGDQMQRVGDLKLPANEVINAIVDYANERFGSVGDAATKTITGLENRIVDTLKTVGSAMIEPITAAYKSLLVYLSGSLEALRNAYNTGGLGGVFEFLVPDKDMQTTIRQFIANVRNLLMSLASVASVAANLFGNFAHVVVTAFNIIAPVVTNFINVLSAMLNAMLQNSQVAAVLRVALVAAAGAFVLLRAQAVAALAVTAVTKAITTLSGALLTLANIIVKHPIISLLFALSVSLLGVSVASGKAGNSIRGFFDSLSNASGLSSKDVLPAVKKDLTDTTKAADDFNKRLDETAKNTDNITEAIKQSGKAAKGANKELERGLLSFDEVFKLQDAANTAGGSIGTPKVANLPEGIGGIPGIGDLSGLGEALIPDIPDFSEFIKGFTNGLFGGLEPAIVDKLKSIGIGSLIGSILGAIIGGLIGGPAGASLGMKIGAFAGGFAGLLWDWLKGALSNTGVGAIAGIATAISKAFGGEGIAAIFKTLVNTKSFSGFFKSIGEIFSTTGLKAIVKNGVIGAAIGLVVDAIAHMLWTWMADSIEGANADTAKVGQTIGSVIGTIIGGLIGGPPGAMIGSAIGTFVGGLVGLFWEPIKEYFDPETNALSAFFVRQAERIADWAVETWNVLSTWVADNVIGFTNWASDTFSKLSKWWNDTTSGFTEWFENTFSGFSDWLKDTVKIFTDWDSINGDTLSEWFKDTKERFTGWASDTLESLKQWLIGTISNFVEWRSDTHKEIIEWISVTAAKFSTWAKDTFNVFFSWRDDLLGIIRGWVNTVKETIEEWKRNVTQKFEDFKTTASKVFEGFRIAIVKAVKQWFNETFPELSSGLSKIKTAWDTAWGDIKTSFGTWWTNLKTSMVTWLEEKVWKPISDFFNVEKFWKRISGLLDGIKKKINKWWTGLFDGNVRVSATLSGPNAGHATGGVFNREHVARFAEGNKAEAVIPLENNRAMQPFVDAVSNGLVGSLAPIVAQINAGSANNLPPLYVGTLIADDRGIKQLYDKFEVIRLQESDRRGTTYA